MSYIVHRIVAQHIHVKVALAWIWHGDCYTCIVLTVLMMCVWCICVYLLRALSIRTSPLASKEKSDKLVLVLRRVGDCCVCMRVALVTTEQPGVHLSCGNVCVLFVFFLIDCTFGFARAHLRLFDLTNLLLLRCSGGSCSFMH